MKKSLVSLAFAVVSALIIFFFCACASAQSADGLSLMDAIERSGDEIAAKLPGGSRVVIAAFESPSPSLSDYIMEEMTGALFDRGVEVADRRNLEYVYKEQNFQMSGNVSDETAKSIGKFLGADMVITGQLVDLEEMYRYRTSAINVETAVHASVTRLDVRSDAVTRRLAEALTAPRVSIQTAKYGVSEEKTPTTPGTYLDRGIMFMSRGEYDKAIADFTEAIRLNPDYTAAYNNRGSAYYNKGEYDKAIADFEAALRIDPDHADAMQNLERARQVIMRN